MNDKKVTRAWAFYDWAYSSYALIINSTIFPIYFSSVVQNHSVQIFGHSYAPMEIFGYSLTLSFLMLCFLSPVLSAMADVLGRKKLFMQIFCYLGSLSCMLIFFFDTPAAIWIALLTNITACIGYYGSQIFYNSYLPQIASKDKQDMLSARGFAWGYVGSLLLLTVCLVLIEIVADPSNQGMYTRLSFLITGLWWAVFSQYTFKYLPKDQATVMHDQKIKTSGLIRKSFTELGKVGKNVFNNANLRSFLFAFFMYSMGMQTIFLMATFFGKNEINLGDTELIGTIMALQIEAIIGALFFSKLAKRIGSKYVLIINVLIWIGACIGAYALNKYDPNVKYQFYAVAGLVGLVMGGLQSLSRSTYSKLMPKTADTATYFSFYDVMEKFSIVVGTFIYSYLIGISPNGSMRNSALAMAIAFIISLAGLLPLRTKKLFSDAPA